MHGPPVRLQLALSHMAEGSSIINCASIQGYSPTPGVLDYATTKVPVTQLLTSCGAAHEPGCCYRHI